MGFSLIASVITGSPDNENVTTPPINTTDAKLIAFGSVYYAGVGPPAPTDSKTNSWVGLTVRTSPGGDAGARIWLAENPIVGSGHTFTLTGFQSYCVAMVSAWAGGVPGAAFDQQNGGGVDNGSSLATGSVTPLFDEELIIAILGTSVLGTGHAFSDLTPLGQISHASQNIGGCFEYVIQGSKATINPNGTWAGGNSNAAAAIATFRPLIDVRMGIPLVHSQRALF